MKRIFATALISTALFNYACGLNDRKINESNIQISIDDRQNSITETASFPFQRRSIQQEMYNDNQKVTCERFSYTANDIIIIGKDGCDGQNLPDGKLDRIAYSDSNKNIEYNINITRKNGYSSHKDIFDDADAKFNNTRNLFAKYLINNVEKQ
jgi:hypothetical protein